MPQPRNNPPPVSVQLLWVFTSVNGRIGREVYWLAWIVINSMVSVFGLAASLQVVADPDTGRLMVQPEGVAAVLLMISYPFLIVISVKRLHDLNVSGLFAIGLLIFPVINIIATVALGLIPGKAGPNRFGDRADVMPVTPPGS